MKTSADLEYKAVDADVKVDLRADKSSDCCCTRLARRKSLRILLIISTCLLCALLLAGILLYFFAFRKTDGSLQFSQSGSNYTLLTEFSFNQTNRNANYSRLSDSANSVMPTVKGRPFWAPCPRSTNFADVLGVFTQDCVLTNNNRCLVAAGSTGTLEILFSPRRNTSDLKMHACGSVMISDEFEAPCIANTLKHEDPCADSNIQCPLLAGRTYLFRAFETATVAFPLSRGTELDVNSYITMVDGSEDDVFCIVLPLRLFIS